MVNILGYEAGWEDLAGPMVWGTKAAIQVGGPVVKDAWNEATGSGSSGGPTPMLNPSAYIYGGAPGRADEAVNKAWATGEAGQQYGDVGMQHGQNVYSKGDSMSADRTIRANRYGQRDALQGDYGAQNATLGQLMALEQQQGPSAAQAQLQAGTNAGMAQQLALARSGRGFGGGAGSAGLAQSNMAGLTANQANSAAMLRAQEDAAWRSRQAGNMGAVAGMQGQQSQANLGAALQSQSQNDAMVNNMLGMGQSAYFQGADARARGVDQAMNGTNLNLQGQGLAGNIRGQEMGGLQAYDDNMIRMWAAQQGHELAQQQRRDQQNAALMNAGTSLAANYATGGGYGAYQATRRGG